MSPLTIEFDKDTDVYVLMQALDGMHGDSAVVEYVNGGIPFKVSGILGHERARVIEGYRLNYRVNGVEYQLDLPKLTKAGSARITIL
jgi:hypothetical protein